MDYFYSLLLGIIEGLTEFLPVSSTAHLRISEALLKMDLSSGFWKTYSVIIQLGAILAIVLYFWVRLVGFVRSYPRGERGDRRWWNHPLALTMLASVVTAGPAYLLHKKIGENLENLRVMAFSLIIGGVVMYLVDWRMRKPEVLELESMTPVDAVWIGLVQILSAVFPGTSRSMSTIAAGQVAGLSRAVALEFSFFVSIPTMFMATGYQMLKLLRPAAGAERIVMTTHHWGVMALGFVVSFIVALGVIAWFMSWVRKNGLAPFALYRIGVGLAILVFMVR